MLPFVNSGSSSLRVALCASMLLVIAGMAPSSFAAAPPSGDRASVPIPKVPIGVSNLVVRLESQDSIGIVGADYKIRLLERLRERGFMAVGAENLVFEKDESRRAEFRLGGIVRELDCMPVRRGVVNCSLGVEWQLLDVARDAVVYKLLARSAVFASCGPVPCEKADGA